MSSRLHHLVLVLRCINSEKKKRKELHLLSFSFGIFGGFGVLGSPTALILHFEISRASFERSKGESEEDD